MDQNTNHFSTPEGISLKEYINDKLASLEKSTDSRFESVTINTNAALAAADRAVNKAEAASEKRFDAVNEFRATLSDQQRTLMPRAESEILIRGLNDKIDALNLTTITKQSKDVGQREGMWTVSVVAGIVSIIVVILSRFIR